MSKNLALGGKGKSLVVGQSVEGLGSKKGVITDLKFNRHCAVTRCRVKWEDGALTWVKSKELTI